MLSPRGRCFTFDSSADGQSTQKREGCTSPVPSLPHIYSVVIVFLLLVVLLDY